MPKGHVGKQRRDDARGSSPDEGEAALISSALRTLEAEAAAERLGVPVLREFFNEDLAKRLAAEGKQADLIAGNNVYAHVPEINDFTRGLRLR